MTTLNVTDFLSNLNDQLANSAKLMQRSKHRQAVFEAIYRGQKQEKTVEEIMDVTGLSQVHVLNEGKKLGPLVEKIKGGYRKRKELAPHYKKILALARDSKKLARLPTKVSPKSTSGHVRITIDVPKSGKVVPVTIDDFREFEKAPAKATRLGPTQEKKIKYGFAKLAGEGGVFTDWGGEKSDLYTNKFHVCGRRRTVAIAFKGWGTSGTLVPKKMGKNGDQIDRLLDEPAEVFLVVYCGQIESSIMSQLRAFAVAKKVMSGETVYVGTVDADDLGRIAYGYPGIFK